MTTEEKAKAYAKKELVRTIRRHAHPLDELAPYFDSKDIQQAYLAGATEVLASQWKDPKVEMPEEVTIDGWVAIDEAYNDCFLHTSKPHQESQAIADTGDYDTVWESDGKTYLLDKGFFPDMDSESDPLEVTITITIKPKKI